MTVSYEPATANNKEGITRRLHLRGIYQGPGQTTDEPIRQAGCGRWIGWIAESADGDPAHVESLVVDGTPVSGWNASHGEMFLGRGGEFRASLRGGRRPCLAIPGWRASSSRSRFVRPTERSSRLKSPCSMSRE